MLEGLSPGRNSRRPACADSCYGSAHMQVAARKVVSIEYTLKDDKGEVLDTSVGKDPLQYLHGANNIVPGLERALEGKAIGDSVEVTLTPEDGYGQRDEKAIRNVPLRKLPHQRPAAGMRLRVDTDIGPRIVTVTAVRGDYATVDANHPLAGQTLHFNVTIKDLREPTEEEIAHGHVHGPGGHH